MKEPIYFSKVEFRERIGYGYDYRSIILLNIPARELSYQVFKHTVQMPAIQSHVLTKGLRGRLEFWDVAYPARFLSSSKTNFKPVLIPSNHYEKEVVFSYGIKLDNNQMSKLLPLCNALDFEPYRNREMIMGEEGYVGYRDEMRVEFCGISDSYIPKIELPMSYYYDENHTWPSEKLYRYIINDIFAHHKKMQGWYIGYGGLSLFF